MKNPIQVKSTHLVHTSRTIIRGVQLNVVRSKKRSYSLMSSTVSTYKVRRKLHIKNRLKRLHIYNSLYSNLRSKKYLHIKNRFSTARDAVHDSTNNATCASTFPAETRKSIVYDNLDILVDKDTYSHTVQPKTKNNVINELHSSVENYTYSYMFRKTLVPNDSSTSRKRLKTTHTSPEIIVEIRDQDNKKIPIRALLDTGTTSTLLLKSSFPGILLKPTRLLRELLGVL